MRALAPWPVLDIFKEDDLLSRANVIGERVMGAMREIQEKHPFVGNVQGRWSQWR